MALGDRLFVIGSHAGQGGIWHSSDGGLEWELSAETPTTDAELGAQIHGIARTDAGYVAVGANYVVDGAFPLIWHSTDGDHWTDVTPNPSECIPLQAVTTMGSRFIAVGAVCRYDEQLGPQADGVSFASTDGVHWDRSGVADVLFNIGFADATSTGAATVALGLNFGAWTQTLVSADGLQWTRSSSRAMPPGGYPRRFVWAADRFVAVGHYKDSAEQPFATVWWSTDGATWDQRIVGVPQSLASGIAHDGHEWVVVGNLTDSPASTGFAMAWRSADGLDWAPERIYSDGPAYSADLVATSGGLVGLGAVVRELPGNPWIPVMFRYRD